MTLRITFPIERLLDPAVRHVFEICAKEDLCRIIDKSWLAIRRASFAEKLVSLAKLVLRHLTHGGKRVGPAVMGA